MSEAVAKQSTKADDPQNIKNPALSWMIGFLFLTSFLGLFAVVPLRKVRSLAFRERVENVLDLSRNPFVFQCLFCCSIILICLWFRL